MHSHRRVLLEGAYNTRDLGRLPSSNGTTALGAVFRSDSVNRLTAAGWATLQEKGIRTVIDLRNPEELKGDRHPRPERIRTVHIPLDGRHDAEFWERWGNDGAGTPLYYAAHLERFADLSAAVLKAIAHAQPGGVLFHCEIGRDRTGLISILILSLLGIEPSAIAGDYALSAVNLKPLFESWNHPDEGPRVEAFLARKGTSLEKLIVEFVSSGQISRELRRGGFTENDREALSNRLFQIKVARPAAALD